MRRTNGFTLIELLVVIAIIGVLASVILGALRDARDQGIEAKVKGELNSIQKRAAIEQTERFTYHMVCGTGAVGQSPVIADIIASVNQYASTTVVCNSTNDAFAASAPIMGTQHWCVDSNGIAIATSGPLAMGVTRCE